MEGGLSDTLLYATTMGTPEAKLQMTARPVGAGVSVVCVGASKWETLGPGDQRASWYNCEGSAVTYRTKVHRTFFFTARPRMADAAHLEMNVRGNAFWDRTEVICLGHGGPFSKHPGVGGLGGFRNTPTLLDPPKEHFL